MGFVNVGGNVLMVVVVVDVVVVVVVVVVSVVAGGGEVDVGVSATFLKGGKTLFL